MFHPLSIVSKSLTHIILSVFQHLNSFLCHYYILKHTKKKSFTPMSFCQKKAWMENVFSLMVTMSADVEYFRLYNWWNTGILRGNIWKSWCLYMIILFFISNYKNCIRHWCINFALYNHLSGLMVRMNFTIDNANQSRGMWWVKGITGRLLWCSLNTNECVRFRLFLINHSIFCIFVKVLEWSIIAKNNYFNNLNVIHIDWGDSFFCCLRRRG